jgi:hypothetical protein
LILATGRRVCEAVAVRRHVRKTRVSPLPNYYLELLKTVHVASFEE